MRMAILRPGKPKSGYISEGVADYARRLKRWGGCELICAKAVKPGRNRPEREIKAEEGRRLLAQLGDRDRVWALDPKGELWSSKRWARELAKAAESGAPRLVALVGGALGLARPVLARAHKTVSLGPAVLAHDIATLVVAEQLYRACSIIAGTPYHRG